MCLIVFAYRAHPRYRLILGANRDEFYERPTTAAAFWPDESGLLAGRDLKSGGTWLGLTQSGQVAAVTNYRDPKGQKEQAPSRGSLVVNYLRGRDTPHDYLERLAYYAGRYNGFNLLVGDVDSLYHFSNYEGTINDISPGVHALSNHLLDTPWPKVEAARASLTQLIEADELSPESLLALLDNRTLAPEESLPDTGIGKDWERVLSSIFIESPVYGTRSSTVLLMDHDSGVTFVERTFAPNEAPVTERYDFEIERVAQT